MVWNPKRHLQAETTESLTAALRRLCTCVLAILILGAGAVLTAEEIMPEPAVRAPLAGESLLLDAVAIDGYFVVVGDRGHILTSTDNGDTWQQSDSPSRAPLTGVYFHDRDLGWAVGHDSVILRTTEPANVLACQSSDSR